MFVEFVNVVSGTQGQAELRVLINPRLIAAVSELPRGDVTQIVRPKWVPPHRLAGTDNREAPIR
jgi:hypothetical protein